MDDDLLLLIISSPSGAGKTTLTKDLLAHFSEMTFSVSHTTRSPRVGEVDGRDYHFVDMERFRRLAQEGRFAEWAEVHGHLYGTSVDEIERCRREARRVLVFDIDYQGARQIKAKRPDAVSVFILPPSMDSLRARLRKRASDSEETIARRFGKAREEIEHYGLSDYVIVNDDLEQAKQRLRAVVTAEQCRRWRLAHCAEQLIRQGFADSR